jgi:hypothetical protein
VVYASSTSALATGSGLSFNGTDTLTIANVVGTGKFGLYSESTGVAFGGISTTNYLRFLVTNAEGMRLTSTGLGIGTSSPGALLDVSSPTQATGAIVRLTNAASSSSWVAGDVIGQLDFYSTDASLAGTKAQIKVFADTGNDTVAVNTSVISFSTMLAASLTEKMRITSAGNVGIGTTAPRSTLNVVGDITLGATPGAAVAGTAYAITGNSAVSGSAAGGNLTINAGAGSGVAANGDLTLRAGQTVSPLSSTSGGNVIIESGKPSNGNTSGYIAFNSYTGNPSAVVERMRIDTSGNLGLGVTPSAWWAAYNVLEINSAGNAIGAVSAGSQIQITGNAYQSGAGVYTYGQTGYLASLYSQSNGSHSWSTAPSGTAGGTITFTQAMTLDTSGNLLVGTTTSPSGSSQIAITDNARFHLGTFGGINSIRYNTPGAVGMYFTTAGTDQMVLTNAGNLLMGGTAARGTTVGTAHLDLFNGTAPAGTLTNGVSLYSSSGDLKFMNAAGTDFDVGYRNIPQNSQSAAYTLVLADAGKHIFHPSTDANARTYTIPANSSVAYPIGTAITFINMTSQVVTIAITTDTMYLSSAGTTGSRSLSQYGSATAIKMTSTTWLISGSGLT